MTASKPQPSGEGNLRFQFSVRSLLLATMGIAIVLSTYSLVGWFPLKVAVSRSALVGIVFIMLTRRLLGRYCLVAFCGAIIGGVLAVKAAECNGDVILMKSRDSRVPTIRSDLEDNMAFTVIGPRAVLGALGGGMPGVLVGAWLASRKSRLNKDAPRAPLARSGPYS